MTRSYSQYCPVAHALDLVGERWSLLVVRELAHGPLRYSDLHEHLPGCGTNILAARLRTLEEGGVVARRKLPPPAGSTVYELTPLGEGLRPVLHELAHWGARSLGPPTGDVELVPGWLARALRTAVASATAPGRYAFAVGEEEAGIVGGAVVEGRVPDPDVRVRCDGVGFYHLLVDRVVSPDAEVEGDGALLERLLASLPPAPEPALPTT